MSTYTIVIIVTFVGFAALAAALLVPVYRFLKREERVSEKWTGSGDVEWEGGRAGDDHGASASDLDASTGR